MEQRIVKNFNLDICMNINSLLKKNISRIMMDVWKINKPKSQEDQGTKFKIGF